MRRGISMRRGCTLQFTSFELSFRVTHLLPYKRQQSQQILKGFASSRTRLSLHVQSRADLYWRTSGPQSRTRRPRRPIITSSIQGGLRAVRETKGGGARRWATGAIQARVRHDVQPRGAHATNTSLAALEHPSSPRGPSPRTGLRSVASETRFSRAFASGLRH